VGFSDSIISEEKSGMKPVVESTEVTGVFLPEGHRSRLAVGYGQRRADGSRRIMPFTDFKGLTPAGNISSTVEDLARFISFQFSDGHAGGVQVLKESTLREMHCVQWLAPDWKSGSGLGFRIRRDEGRVLCGHGGSVSGYRSHILFAPEEKVGVVCLANADDVDAWTLADRIMRWMAPTIVKAVSPPPESKKVVFEMGEDGKPLRVRVGATYVYPVSSWMDEVKEV